MAIIVIAENRSGHTVLRHAVQNDAANIGRAPDVDLLLPTSNVSQYHARILVRDGGVVITDLKSTNGTFLNGVRIEQAKVVLIGDTVQIGDWTIRWANGEDADANANASPNANAKPHPKDATVFRFTPRDPHEKSLIDAILAAPHDDGLRQVYGDWLEERGYSAESELLSIEREIRRGGTTIDPHELGRLGYRMRTIASSLPHAWRVIVARSPIESCDAARVNIPCPKSWDWLSTTENPYIRRCGVCSKDVFYAKTVKEGRKHVSSRHLVVVDATVERYARDLDDTGAIQRDDDDDDGDRASAPPPPTTPQRQEPTIVMELPFFAKPEPPTSVGELMSSLRLTPPDNLPEYSNMGSLLLPPVGKPGSVDHSDDGLSALILRLWINYHFDIHHETPRERFEDIAWKRYSSFTIHICRPPDSIDAWLSARHGPPREVTYQSQAVTTPYRVYGNWLISTHSRGATCSLEWYAELPEWALPTMDTHAAFAFLSELITLMQREASYEELTALAARPPARSGILVTGPLNRGDFWLGFEPKLNALELAGVFGIASDTVVGRSGDVHMSSWDSGSLVQGRVQSPVYGPWMVEIGIDGWPSGDSVPEHYACKRITPKDRVRVLSLRRSFCSERG